MLDYLSLARKYLNNLNIGFVVVVAADVVVVVVFVLDLGHERGIQERRIFGNLDFALHQKRNFIKTFFKLTLILLSMVQRSLLVYNSLLHGLP